MHSMQIVEWGKPLEPRDRSTPKPQGTKLAIAVRVMSECVTSASGSESAVLPKPRVSV